jgi:hypothetical protein
MTKRNNVPETVDVIRARSFEIVDSNGNVRVRIGPDAASDHGEDYYNVEMFDRSGSRAVRLRSWPNGGGFVELGNHQIGMAYMQGGNGSPFNDHGASLILEGGSGLGSRYGVWVYEGSFPRTYSDGPAIHLGSRPASRAELVRALPETKRWVDQMESERAGGGDLRRSRQRGREAAAARRHVRKLCAEFKVEIPEWATAKGQAAARRLT